MAADIEASFFPRMQTSSFGSAARGNMETCEVEGVSEITDLLDHSTQQFFSTSAVLNYCQQRIILPYTRLLGFLGLRPLLGDINEPNIAYNAVNKIHLFFVTSFLMFGYIMQAFTCYRRDVGFAYTLGYVANTNYLVGSVAHLSSSVSNHTIVKCDGNLFFCYVLPQLLHLCAFLYTTYLLRMTENEHLQTLFEKVFLLTSRSRGTLTQRSLLRRLRINVILSVLWVVLALVAQLFLVSTSSMRIVSFLPPMNFTLRCTLIGIMIAATICQDVVHCVVISNYCIECQLLMAYAQSISDRVIDKSLSLEAAMKEFLEYEKFLVYLNDNVAPAIGLLLMLSCTRAVVTTMTATEPGFLDDTADSRSPIILMLVIQWISISAAPFIFAAFVTATSRSVRSLGQKIRVRPFGYQDTPMQYLDSFVTFTACHKRSANLFFVPISAGRLGVLVSASALVFVIHAQVS